ncbi:MAG: hypothetical protein VX113_09840, partial [Pseudomonadota bacterium]|nr:hypothetical protein [Pseudomonadota bacterium]
DEQLGRAHPRRREVLPRRVRADDVRLNRRRDRRLGRRVEVERLLLKPPPLPPRARAPPAVVGVVVGGRAAAAPARGGGI